MPESTPGRSLPRRHGFLAVGTASFLLTASSSAPSPLYPLYQQQWGFSPGMLTAVFAVYALALLATLLTIGSISDHVGRRPVLIGALLLLVVSMGVFVLADDVGWLVLARVLQGLAVGAATGAVSAAVIDLQPSPRLGSFVNSVAPSLGLALGAAGAGLLVQFAPFPTVLVYVLVVVIALSLAVVLVFVPDRVPAPGFASRRAALRSLLPSASVPAGVRGPYLVILPGLLSAWSLGGLYMSLGPSIVGTVFGIGNRLVAGLAICTLFASGSVAATMLRGFDPRRVVVAGTVILAAGVGVVVTAVLGGWAVAYFAGTAVAGFGWGAAFLGAMNVIGALAAPHERGRLFATTFVVCYLAFSVPAVIAGLAAGVYGLTATTLGYGGAVIVLALGAGAGVALRGPRKPGVHRVETPVLVR
ncbi:Multidrug resistance protein MdtL [Rhodococcus ruber]|uniref:MFS transporter n=1 Tax=Rhodococcus ruber TaxID=1830 RepID=UPI00315CCAB9